MIVPRVRTRMTRAEIRAALAEAHVAVFGAPAPAPRLAVATCQAWLETGNGGACWCFNFGNVDWLPDIGGDAFEFEAREVIHGEDVFRTKRLCAFTSAAEGAAHQWRRLRDRYPRSLAAFDLGDGEKAARALKSERYYTASETSYAGTMTALLREYARAFGGW